MLEKERNMHEKIKICGGRNSKGWNEFHEYIKFLILGKNIFMCEFFVEGFTKKACRDY